MLFSCDNNIIEEPTLEISTSKTTYKVGETVIFDIQENSELISFFSGELGKNYEYVNRTRADGKPTLTFISTAKTGTQLDGLALMISNDFIGMNDTSKMNRTQAIQNATWYNISDSAKFSQSSTAVSSGNVNLSAYATSEHTTIAFKYTARKEATPQGQWTIKSLVLSNVLPDGSSFPLFSDISAPGWLALNILNSTNLWASSPSTSAGQLFITGGGANSEPNEDWIVSAQVNLKTVTPDLGVPIKSMGSRLNKYFFTTGYKLPGIYTATFVGSNNRVSGSKIVVRKIQITVTN